MMTAHTWVLRALGYHRVWDQGARRIAHQINGFAGAVMRIYEACMMRYQKLPYSGGIHTRLIFLY